MSILKSKTPKFSLGVRSPCLASNMLLERDRTFEQETHGAVRLLRLLEAKVEQWNGLSENPLII